MNFTFFFKTDLLAWRHIGSSQQEPIFDLLAKTSSDLESKCHSPRLKNKLTIGYGDTDNTQHTIFLLYWDLCGSVSTK